MYALFWNRHAEDALRPFFETVMLRMRCATTTLKFSRARAQRTEASRKRKGRRCFAARNKSVLLRDQMSVVLSLIVRAVAFDGVLRFMLLTQHESSG